MGNISLLQNFVIMKVMLKTVWGEKEGLMWEVVEVGKWGRWEGSEVARWEK